MTKQYDWTTFTKQIFIKAPVDDIFNAWAIPANITKWFIAEADLVSAAGHHRPPSEPACPGDQYTWRWHQDVQATGTILSVSEDQAISFTFGNKMPDSEEKIVVSVTCEAVEGATLVTLKQENMADSPEAHVNWHLGCNLGWSFFMTNLKALLEHGVDLRETDPERAYASRAISH